MLKIATGEQQFVIRVRGGVGIGSNGWVVRLAGDLAFCKE